MALVTQIHRGGSDLQKFLENGKILGQLRPANTTAASLYSPATGFVAVVTHVVVCNTTSGAVTFRVFVDSDGTTYDETTALYFDVALAANVTTPLELNVPLNEDGNLAVRTSSGSAINFTAWGLEHST